jgi:nitroreductase
MTRAFDQRDLPPGLIEELVELGLRAPSAGKTQGFDLVVLEGDQTALFWSNTMSAERRARFRWQALLDAPVIMIPVVDPGAYLSRYAEPDKSATGLGDGVESWPVPYWTVDGSMAVMTILLAAEAVGLGALFFGIFRGETALREALGIPPGRVVLGAVALGWPKQGESDALQSRGRSSSRPRRSVLDVIHRGGW